MDLEVGQNIGHQFPELRPVVVVDGVRQFVDHHVIHHFRRRHQQTPGEGQLIFGVTRSPARAGGGDAQSAIGEMVQVDEVIEAGLQIDAGLFLVPVLEMTFCIRLGILSEGEVRAIKLQGRPLGRDQGQRDGLSQPEERVACLEGMAGSLCCARLQLGLGLAHPVRFLRQELLNGRVGQLQRRADGQCAVRVDHQRQRPPTRAHKAIFRQGRGHAGKSIIRPRRSAMPSPRWRVLVRTSEVWSGTSLNTITNGL